jgi:hypothetical protein
LPPQDQAIRGPPRGARPSPVIPPPPSARNMPIEDDLVSPASQSTLSAPPLLSTLLRGHTCTSRSEARFLLRHSRASGGCIVLLKPIGLHVSF